MLTLSLDDFMVELAEGTVKHVGAANTAATVKLYHVDEAEARAFGDSQVKFAFEDGEGNEVEVALDPEAVESLLADVEAVREEGVVFE
ncbi:hypothetical protein ACFO0N_13900 [Halobium salinum]|uniref:Uncharacterized protein n=1 Tax=Halobium salinum TaxID=1364940 RepID=A0ABD5PE88_9EURY|nr:hypothetical protein [Halobium salinum]